MPDINNIPDGPLYSLQDQHFRVTITNEDTGEVVYSHPSKGGILCTVEEIHIDSPGVLDGNQQHLMWGPPAVVCHASLQHERNIKKVMRANPEFEKLVRAYYGV